MEKIGTKQEGTLGSANCQDMNVQLGGVGRADAAAKLRRSRPHPLLDYEAPPKLQRLDTYSIGLSEKPKFDA